MARGGRFQLRRLSDFGLPGESGALEVWLGLREATGLHRAIQVKGSEQSILEHARAVVKGMLDGEALIDAISALPEAESIFALDRMLRFDEAERMTSFPWQETEAAAARWLVKLVNRLGAKAVAKVGELVTLAGGGTPPRIYVWSLVTPNIAATPRKVAAELRCMGEEEQELLSEILAKLPDAERILSVEPSNATKAAKAKPTKAKPTKAKRSGASSTRLKADA